MTVVRATPADNAVGADGAVSGAPALGWTRNGATLAGHPEVPNVPLPMREDVRPQPVSPYGVTKLSAEQLCHLYWVNYGVPTASMRYFTVYGPRQRPDMAFARMVAAAANGDEFELYGDGSQSRSFTFVRDVVDATIRALDAAPGIYNVGGGEESTMREALALLEEVAGRPLRVRPGPLQTGDMHRTKADTTRIEDAIGWRATTPLRAGLAEHWAYVSARVGTA